MAIAPAHIVIVGAGPCGAMLAYLLASRGGDALRVTLIERQDDFAREFRGEVLMPSGVAVIRQAGIGDAFAQVPSNALRSAEVFRRNKRLITLDLEQSVGAGAAFRAVSQPAMLEMLVREAQRCSNFRFERGVAVRDLVQRSGRVTGVETVRDGVAGTIEANMVVGADGRASIVRKRSGLDAIRRPQAFDIVWCKVPAPPTAMWELNVAKVFIGDRHFALAFPTHDGRLQIAWVIRKGAIGELRRAGIEHWIEQMAAHVSDDFARHLRSNLQHITQPFLLDVICDLMPQWSKPGLLLLGDAAHPMSPVGGQGINIALRDAVVAANHLIDAARRGGDEQALDVASQQTQAERMPEVKRVQRLQQFPPRLLFASPLISRGLLAILPLLVKTGVPTGATNRILRRFALGVSDVQLRV